MVILFPEKNHLKAWTCLETSGSSAAWDISSLAPFPTRPPLVPGAWERGVPQPLSAVLTAQRVFMSPPSTPRPAALDDSPGPTCGFSTPRLVLTVPPARAVGAVGAHGEWGAG